MNIFIIKPIEFNLIYFSILIENIYQYIPKKDKIYISIASLYLSII